MNPNTVEGRERLATLEEQMRANTDAHKKNDEDHARLFTMLDELQEHVSGLRLQYKIAVAVIGFIIGWLARYTELLGQFVEHLFE